jgi:diacylglycerol kinase family enzyme
MALTTFPTTRKPLAQRALSRLPVVQPDPNRVAVLLNRNARRVSDKLAKKLERAVGVDNFFYSKSLEQAEGFAREIVQRGYGTVICGGGDGTLARTVNLVHRYIEESNQWRTERYSRFGEVQSLLASPRFGFLKLGTGNGISTVVGAGDPVTDVERIIDYAPGRTWELPLIESDGERFFFGGMGYDSMLLNDYNALKARTTNRILKPFMHTVGGYFAAMLARTVPRALTQGKASWIEGRVTNLGRCYYIDPRRGDAAVEIDPGTTLFDGNASIISAGTSPYYGYGFKMFPFASMVPGMMHLRIATIGPVETLTHLPAIWKGSYRSPRRIFDYLIEAVRVDLNRPFPFQHSGDAQGMRTQLDLRIAPERLRLVDYYTPRLVD